MQFQVRNIYDKESNIVGYTIDTDKNFDVLLQKLAGQVSVQTELLQLQHTMATDIIEQANAQAKQENPYNGPILVPAPVQVKVAVKPTRAEQEKAFRDQLASSRPEQKVPRSVQDNVPILNPWATARETMLNPVAIDNGYGEAGTEYKPGAYE